MKIVAIYIILSIAIGTIVFILIFAAGGAMFFCSHAICDLTTLSGN